MLDQGKTPQAPACDQRAGASACTPLLQICDARVRRAGKDILAVDALTLAEGESIALLGPNGSGKSTFVSLITREVMPLHRDESPVRYRGSDRITLADLRQTMGVVSSSMQDQIRVHLPARDIVAGGLFGSLGVPLRRQVTDEQRACAQAIMEELDIADLADRDILTLSTGQARRVLMARALVHRPDVLIFDEPCTGLDPAGMYYVRRTMAEVAQSGRTVVLVTHYPEDIVPAIRRLVLVKNGRIVADGSKEALLTDDSMSELFEVPLAVTESRGIYSLRAAD